MREGEDHTMIFILVHSSTRAISSPLHNNAKIFTISHKSTPNFVRMKNKRVSNQFLEKMKKIVV